MFWWDAAHSGREFSSGILERVRGIGLSSATVKRSEPSDGILECISGFGSTLLWFLDVKLLGVKMWNMEPVLLQFMHQFAAF